MSLKIKSGGTSLNSFVFQDIDKNPIDLTGATFQLLIKEKYGGVDLVREVISDIPEPELGIVNVTIEATTTTSLNAGQFPSEVKLTNIDGQPFYSHVFKSSVESIIDDVL